jgi:hypothetical protein
MAEAFLRLTAKDRLDALGVAADRLGRPAHLLEKDVWVVWAIQQLFGSPVGTNLVFKGGTSLSKAYQVIDRFSEDVDLTFDIRALIPDLLEGREDAMPATSSEERRWSKRVRQALPEWVAGTIQPILQQAIDREGIDAGLRIDGDKLFIDYPHLAQGTGYVSPSVMLEFGARSTGEPASSARHCLRCRVGDRKRGVSGCSSPRDACRANVLGEGDGYPRLLLAETFARRSLLAALARPC